MPRRETSRPHFPPGDFSMMTSGLVVKLKPETPAGLIALAKLQDTTGLTIGERGGSFVSLALEAADAEESERLHEWLRGLDGVADVEVVFVHWGNAEVENAGS